MVVSDFQSIQPNLSYFMPISDGFTTNQFKLYRYTLQHGYLELSHVKMMTNPDLIIANCQDDPGSLPNVGANHHLVLVC